MSGRYESLNDEFLPMDEMNISIGIMKTMKENKRGQWRTEISLENNGEVTCCFTVPRFGTMLKRYDGWLAKVYWQESGNLLASFFEKKYILHMEVFNHEEKIVYTKYKHSLGDFLSGEHQEKYPYLFWYLFSAFSFFLIYVFFYEHLVKHEG